jgi:ABC-2 type transport system permease protein
VRRILDAFELFFLNAKIVLMRMMAYRVDFVLSLIVTLGFSAMGPLFQYLLYSNSRGYPGWNFDQILVFQAALLLLGGLAETCFGSIRASIDALMANGEFDRLLLKPWPPLLLIMTSGFNPAGLGSLSVGLGLTVWASLRIGLPGGLAGVGLFAVFLAARLALQAGVHILYCFFTVRWVYTMRLSEIMDKILAWGNFPLEVFPRVLQLIFVTFVPFSIACYWPAKALLGPVGILALASLGGTALFLTLTILLWRGQLKSYASAGG